MLQVLNDREIRGRTVFNGAVWFANEEFTPAELGVINGVTPGTVSASKALIVDASKNLGDLNVVNMARLNGVSGALAIVSPATTITATTKLSLVGMLDVGDVLAGGASNGNIIKKTLQASEAYTGTTAGLMVKHYGTALATVPSGEFTGLYVNVKGLHVSPGNNASLISAHVHGSNTTVIHAGLWLYGDMTNGVKASGSTLTNMVDISEATAVTNLLSLPALSTAPCSGQTTADYTFTKTCKISILIGGAQYYLIADTTA